jgi:hypothetical protein
VDGEPLKSITAIVPASPAKHGTAARRGEGEISEVVEEGKGGRAQFRHRCAHSAKLRGRRPLGAPLLTDDRHGVVATSGRVAATLSTGAASP